LHTYIPWRHLCSTSLLQYHCDLCYCTVLYCTVLYRTVCGILFLVCIADLFNYSNWCTHSGSPITQHHTWTFVVSYETALGPSALISQINHIKFVSGCVNARILRELRANSPKFQPPMFVVSVGHLTISVGDWTWFNRLLAVQVLNNDLKVLIFTLSACDSFSAPADWTWLIGLTFSPGFIIPGCWKVELFHNE